MVVDVVPPPCSLTVAAAIALPNDVDVETSKRYDDLPAGPVRRTLLTVSVGWPPTVAVGRRRRQHRRAEIDLRRRPRSPRRAEFGPASVPLDARARQK